MADTITRRRPVSVLDTVSRGSMLTSTAKARKDKEKGRPESNWGLGIAEVASIDYEEFYVTLRTITGTSDTFERVPVPMTFPGAGARHFLGAMPEVGDLAVVDWIAESTSRSEMTKTPVIVGWAVPGVWPGRDWLTTSDFEIDEYDMDAPKERQASPALRRIRHKLRHIQPGMIVGSSAQGADMVLDEGVLFSNRRGNEFRLRDQDQAAITRALQKFDVLAGARVYAGMVQRDATFLAPDMVSDGRIWDGPLQAIGNMPVAEWDLPNDLMNKEGFLTPARPMQRSALSAEDGYLGRTGIQYEGSIDPYQFLQLGGIVDETGYVVGDRFVSDAIYGGKSLFRVASQRQDNAVLDPDAPTLTEYRIEVTHTSDGRLPVSEQTDGFDSERLPQQPGEVPGPNPNAPFMEFVMGSVVGNDPYSQMGRSMYGLPIKAVVFDGPNANPRLEAANVTVAGSGVSPTPLGEQAASLFRINPPLPDGAPQTFVSYNKKGQLKAAIGGPVNENSAEVYMQGGLKLGIGGAFEFLLQGHTHIGTLSKSSLFLTAEDGAVRIFGAGPIRDQSAEVERTTGTGNGEGDLPSVDIEALTNMRLKAGQAVFIQGDRLATSTTSASIRAHQDLTLDGVKRVAITTEQFQKTVAAKASESYSGPKLFLPTFAPLHERTYTPPYPGIVCEAVTYVFGDREETFYLGNHKTTMLIGNMSYETNLGTWKARAVTSQMEMGPTGITASALVGNVSMQATAGTLTVQGLAGANLVATAGQAQVRGATGVYLGAPLYGPDAGPIICAGSLEPFTNLPFATWGLGAKAHVIGS
jgi:hypothetical protein